LTFFDITRAPLLRAAALAGIIGVACCAARSDARPEIDPSRFVDMSHVVGTWFAPPRSEPKRYAAAFPNENADIASAQGMLSEPKYDDAEGIGARIAPLRVDTVVRSHRLLLALDPVIRLTAHLAPGERETARPGSPQVAWVTERLTYWNDVVVDRQVVSREIVDRGTRGLVLEGTPKTLSQLRSDRKYRVAVSMTMVATAYTADTATAYPTGYTATGILAHQGVVAVDPQVIPLGSTVFVPGYGIAIAADTGGAIIGHRIDLCMDSYTDAVNFGRQVVQVYVLKR